MPDLELPAEPLGDAVVSLRPWSEADVPERLMAFADPTVQRYSWPHTRAYTEEDARSFFTEQRRAQLAGAALSFALTEPDDPEAVLGGASLYAIDPDLAGAAVGYWLAPTARGRGAATHAVRLLADWAFRSLEIERLRLECAPDNHASRRVAERCGFAFEGTLRSHIPFKGGRRDTALYSLPRSEWERPPSK